MITPVLFSIIKATSQLYPKSFQVLTNTQSCQDHELILLTYLSAILPRYIYDHRFISNTKLIQLRSFPARPRSFAVYFYLLQISYSCIRFENPFFSLPDPPLQFPDVNVIWLHNFIMTLNLYQFCFFFKYIHRAPSTNCKGNVIQARHT